MGGAVGDAVGRRFPTDTDGKSPSRPGVSTTKGEEHRGAANLWRQKVRHQEFEVTPFIEISVPQKPAHGTEFGH